jgi:hypothetical protein
VKWLKRVGLLLLASLLVGFAIGTWIRHRAEKPVLYIGSAEPRAPRNEAGDTTAVDPLAPGPSGARFGVREASR